MKAYRTIIAIVLLAGLTMPGALAQKALEALRTKCQLDGQIPKTIITHRDKQTGEKTFTTVQIDIRNNPVLVQEFLAAFAKDEPQAYMIAKVEQNGRSLPKLFQFANEGQSVWYGMIFRDPANVQVIYTQGDVVRPAVAQSAEKEQAPKQKVFYIPKGSTLRVNGVAMTAAQARAKGMDVRELPVNEGK